MLVSRPVPLHNNVITYNMHQQASQHHGKDLENRLKPAFPGSLESVEGYTAPFDIDKRYDTENSLHTSVKCSKSNMICLSSAMRGFSIDEDFRMLFASYKQVGNQKVFDSLTEYLITASEWKSLMGTCTFADIDYFHSNLKKFSQSDYKEARKWAKAFKKAFKIMHPTLKFTLNAKIGAHDNQRRLQMSISKEILDAHVAKRNFFANSYKGVDLNFAIESAPREFKKVKYEIKLENA